MLPYLESIATLLIACGTAFNSYNHWKTRAMLLELQINIRREFNGRYVTAREFDIYSKARSKERLDDRA